MKKDKEKVLDEVWTQDHVKSFLSVRPHDGSDEDFHMLLRAYRSEEHTSELQSRSDLVCRLLLEKKKGNHTKVGVTNKNIS